MPNLKPKEVLLATKLEKIFLVYFSTKGIGGKGKMPHKVGDKYVVTFKVDPELLKELELLATNEKVSKSEIIRRALLLYINYKKGKYYPAITREL